MVGHLTTMATQDGTGEGVRRCGEILRTLHAHGQLRRRTSAMNLAYSQRMFQIWAIRCKHFTSAYYVYMSNRTENNSFLLKIFYKSSLWHFQPYQRSNRANSFKTICEVQHTHPQTWLVTPQAIAVLFGVCCKYIVSQVDSASKQQEFQTLRLHGRFHKRQKEKKAILSYNGANEEMSGKRFWSYSLSGAYWRDFCTSRRRSRKLLLRNEPEDGSSCYDGDAVLMCHMPHFPWSFTS